MAKHKPGTVWPWRRLGDDRPNSYIMTVSPSAIRVELAAIDFVGVARPLDRGIELVLTRQQARMLARRISQCLESTK